MHFVCWYMGNREGLQCVCVCVSGRSIADTCLVCRYWRAAYIYEQEGEIFGFVCVCVRLFLALQSEDAWIHSAPQQVKAELCFSHCVCGVCDLLLMSPHFFNFLSPLCSPCVCMASVSWIYLFSAFSYPSIRLQPPAPIPCWFFSLWIIQACRVCVFSVVVIATVTQTKLKLVRMHTYTVTHTCICIHMPIRTTKTPDSNTKAADELSLQGFHTITVLHPVSALLSQLWIIICLTLLCFPELSECKKMHNLETRNF